MRLARLAAGYDDPEAFGLLVDLSGKQVRNYEAGRVKGLNLDLLETWARLTGKSVDQLIGVGPMEQRERVDHPGVRMLAANAELCKRHRVTPDELQELAQLVLIRAGETVSLRDEGEALQALQLLRSVPPH